MARQRRAWLWLAWLLGGSLLGLALRLGAFGIAAVGLHVVGVLSTILPGLAPSVDPVYAHAALRSQALSDGLDRVSTPLVAALLVGLALLVGYLPTALMLLWRGHARAMTTVTGAAVILSTAACAAIVQQETAIAAPEEAISAPSRDLLAASREPATLTISTAAPPSQSGRAELAPSTFDRWFDDATPMPISHASHVEIIGSNYQFQYLVNGAPESIKGMGLNTQYSHLMSPTQRAAQLDSDMATLSSLGVNTVLGWDPSEFDGVLLDAAQRHGIGVVMPFDLDPQADYTNPSVRQQLRDQVLAWVARYRNYPALRMWGLGNEVLHKIVHPAWVGPQDPQRELEAEVFSDWLIQTADAIHAADPDHPVTYRSAEDAFVAWVVAAVQRDGNVPRPWFVWGTNCYQPYLGDIVDHWPDSGLSSPLWVSEFAPGGIAVPERPDGFAVMWGYITRHPDWVLGGAVYAWTRNGPEGVDRNFGLTDDGEPVDGRSLDMLSTLFHT